MPGLAGARAEVGPRGHAPLPPGGRRPPRSGEMDFRDFRNKLHPKAARPDVLTLRFGGAAAPRLAPGRGRGRRRGNLAREPGRPGLCRTRGPPPPPGWERWAQHRRPASPGTVSPGSDPGDPGAQSSGPLSRPRRTRLPEERLRGVASSQPGAPSASHPLPSNTPGAMTPPFLGHFLWGGAPPCWVQEQREVTGSAFLWPHWVCL